MTVAGRAGEWGVSRRLAVGGRIVEAGRYIEL